MNKIGWIQFGVILTISRIFSEATTIPDTNIVYGMQRYSVIIISFILTFLALVPMFIIAKKYEGSDFIELAASKSRWAAIAFGVIYVIASLYIMMETTVRLNYYATSTIFDSAPAAVLLLFVAGVCIYATVKGLQALTRTGIIVAAGFFVLLFLVVIALLPLIRLSHLYPAFVERPDSFLGEVLSEFTQNCEAVIFAVLCRRVRKDAHRSIYLYLPASCAVLLLMTLLYNTVLGEYLTEVNFPFYTLASISDISILQRLNGVDVVVWLMAAIIRLSLLSITIREIIRLITGKRTLALWSGIAAILLTAGATYFLTGSPELFRVFISIRETVIPVIIIVAVLPLTGLIMGRKSYEKK